MENIKNAIRHLKLTALAYKADGFIGLYEEIMKEVKLAEQEIENIERTLSHAG